MELVSPISHSEVFDESLQSLWSILESVGSKVSMQELEATSATKKGLYYMPANYKPRLTYIASTLYASADSQSVPLRTMIVSCCAYISGATH